MLQFFNQFFYVFVTSSNLFYSIMKNCLNVVITKIFLLFLYYILQNTIAYISLNNMFIKSVIFLFLHKKICCACSLEASQLHTTYLFAEMRNISIFLFFYVFGAMTSNCTLYMPTCTKCSLYIGVLR